MSFHEGSKWQEQMEDRKKFASKTEKQQAKVDKSKYEPQPPTELDEYETRERLASTLEVFHKACTSSESEFIAWTYGNDWHFMKPIKIPKI